MNENDDITPRQRIVKAIHFKEVDKLPWYENVIPELVLKWISEGLSTDNIIQIEHRVAPGQLIFNRQIFTGYDVQSVFGYDNLRSYVIPVDEGPIPRFKYRQIDETDRYVEYLMENGAVARLLKKGYQSYSMPQFIDFPVKDLETWKEYKKRLDPEDPRRYPNDWDIEEYIKFCGEYDKGSTMIQVTGFYGFGAELMGIPKFNLSFYKDPELIHDMISHWEHFTIERLRNTVEALKDRVDLVFWWEDMASKHGPNISPKLYREFLLPHYKKVIDFLNKNNINRIMMDSDGNINPILDSVVEAGITGVWPLEVHSGMDVIAIREKYGKKLFLAGNLDKRKVAEGGEIMRGEVDSKLPTMKDSGGYVAGLDHVVPIYMSLEKFQEYTEYIKKQLKTDQ